MTTNVVVSVGDARKCVTCAPGMLVNELRYVLGARGVFGRVSALVVALSSWAALGVMLLPSRKTKNA